mmetsp:Transcript_6540/g.16019  ORF Transcript_6540/g.16019 Transcript_6540/m.16019 type:complete len:788 (+) Transcript_6540:122-2485(+)
MATGRKDQPDSPVGKYKVVYKNVAVRSGPSVKARILYVAKQGNHLEGSVHVVDGNPWLELNTDSRHNFDIPADHKEAWVLIHGASVGLEDLLRPVNEEVECLEELLTRIGGGSSASDRVPVVVQAVHATGLRLGSQLLAATDVEREREELHAKIASEAAAAGCHVPERFVSYLRKTVEDSRLGMGGFPGAPPNTKVRMIFTAPHSIPLCREGHRPHQPEAYTSSIARDLARAVGGAFLTWSRLEEGRAREYYKVTGGPDPMNKDPNYLRVEDLSDSPWTRNLQEVRRLWHPLKPALHVDLHGCQDPGPSSGSDLVVGLRAMEFAGRKRTEDLRQLLYMCLSMGLRGLSINVRPNKQLTGALEAGHCTLSQQSLTNEGGAYTCSVQLEMSRTLRQRLHLDPQVKNFLAQALKHAWVLFCSEAPEGPPITHTLGHWVLTCKAFYQNQPVLFVPDGQEEHRQAPEPSPEDEAATGDGEEEQLPSNYEDERGEVTANSEARAPPFDVPMSDVESELTKMARALHEKLAGIAATQGNGGFLLREPALVLTPVTLLRDWLRGSSDDLPALQPRHDFFIVGSWSAWKCERMIWDGSRFCRTIEIQQGGSAFIIQQNGLADCKLYPSQGHADPTRSPGVLGPDDNCNGRKWRLVANEGGFTSNGQRVAPSKESYIFDIFLHVDVHGLPLMISATSKADGGSAKARDSIADTRKPAKPRSALKVVVHIDRDQGHQLEVKVLDGDTVGVVKEEVAKTDPSGAIRPEDFFLSSAGQKLDVTVPITGAHAELDLCFQGA